MPASYFPLDINFFDHPKVDPLGDKTLRMHLAAIGYANRLMTDGLIAPSIPGRLVEWDWNDSDVKNPWQMADELIEAVLWHKAAEPCPRGHTQVCPEFPGADGWRIHDFLDHNRSKERRLKEQEAERDRKANWRERKRKTANDAETYHPDTTVSGDAGVPAGQHRHRDAGHPQDKTVTGTPERRLTETETETETEEDQHRRRASATEHDDPIAVVFDAWRESTGKHRSQLDDKRRRRIKAALRSYPLPDVLDAVRGWANSPHHRGENEQGTVYNELTLLLRDAEHIERFRDLWRAGPPNGPPGKATLRMVRTAQQMRRWAEQMEGGDGDPTRVGTSRPAAQRELPGPAG